MEKWIGLALVGPTFAGTVLFQAVRGRFVDFACDHCGQHFHVSPTTAALAPKQFGGRKRLKCPQCGATTWASPVAK